MTSLTETLADMGFGGLWRSCSIGSMEDINRDCLDLTEKLIEVSKLYGASQPRKLTIL